MLYESTRGHSEKVTASQAILRGIAPDGGLYVPQHFPKCSFSLEQLQTMNYIDLAFTILQPFLTDFSNTELMDCLQKAYGNGFDTDTIAPIVEKNNAYFLELFHGKTLAFKDMALSLLPHLLVESCKKQQVNKEIVILAATSGDTGKAALSGFADVPNTQIVVFYPLGGVSYVQQLQMLTQQGNNTHVIGIEGNFDDAQNGVKHIFNDNAFNQLLSEKGVLLSSANSINIGRLLPQIVYYFYAYGQMCKNKAISIGQPLNFVVPTGNFGNILAGYYAKQMGLPIGSLVCASNKNNVLFDFFQTNIYDRNREFTLTISPSMDILISSNLERLLYHVSSRDGAQIKQIMEQLAQNGRYCFNAKESGIVPVFATEENTKAAISKMATAGYVMDTHTAVAYSGYEQVQNVLHFTNPSVIVSTASPYKFAADVLGAIDGNPHQNEAPQKLFAQLEELSHTPIPKPICDLDTLPILHNQTCKKDTMAQALLSAISVSVV